MIRIGTRGSLLATTQAGAVRDALVAKGHPAELVIISTEGDRSDQPIADIGVGVFTAALREAIARRRGRHGRALVQGFADRARSAVRDRGDTRRAKTPRDALVARDGLVLGELPAGLGDRHVEPAAGRAA